MNQRGCPSLRMASDVCSRCSIWVRSVSGSLSSTSVLRYSAISQMLFVSEVAVLGFFLEYEVVGLASVIFAVELGDARIGLGLIVAELSFGFALLVASGDEVVPIF